MLKTLASKIILIGIVLVAIVTIFTVVNKKDTSVSPDVEVSEKAKASDYNSSRSNRTTSSGINLDCGDGTILKDGDCIPEAVDNDCDDPHSEGLCEKLDSDDDGDAIPIDDSTEAQASGYIKIDDIAGETTETR